MKARCEKAEKEKSEILLRRLATMESMSSKTSTSEVAKLQKKNEGISLEFYHKLENWKHFFNSIIIYYIHISALTQEKNVLLTKIKSLEKETTSRPYRAGEKDKVQDELRSKLRAAENLCESLMDENEDMKKEIRQLEEEIYELQDNFRYYIFLRYKRYY